ncbi:MAG TPA: NlpC/P60 family protein [Micromonosporaceae bacterium]|nr:NlpC/P60 family protein [Micromonosporaceae bacterium]
MRVHRTLLRTVLSVATAAAVLTSAGAAVAAPSPDQVDKQIEQASNAFEDIVEAYNGIGEELKATQAAAAELQTKMQPLQNQMDAAYGNVSAIAAAAYKNAGGISDVSALLGAGSSATMVDQLAALRHISQARQHDLDGYTALQKQYSQEKSRLDDLLAQQTAQQQDLTGRRAKIEADLQNLRNLRTRFQVPAGKAPPASVTAASPPPNVSGSAGRAVSFAFGQLGKPYYWGADGPNSYDCSGLTLKAWAAAGVTLPHNAAQQWRKVRHISRSALQPGDLVFYRGLKHVGIYIGGNTIIHAPNADSQVRKASVDVMAPYGYGRPG